MTMLLVFAPLRAVYMVQAPSLSDTEANSLVSRSSLCIVLSILFSLVSRLCVGFCDCSDPGSIIRPTWLRRGRAISPTATARRSTMPRKDCTRAQRPYQQSHRWQYSTRSSVLLGSASCLPQHPLSCQVHRSTRASHRCPASQALRYLLKSSLLSLSLRGRGSQTTQPCRRPRRHLLYLSSRLHRSVKPVDGSCSGSGCTPIANSSSLW